MTAVVGLSSPALARPTDVNVVNTAASPAITAPAIVADRAIATASGTGRTACAGFDGLPTSGKWMVVGGSFEGGSVAGAGGPGMFLRYEGTLPQILHLGVFPVLLAESGQAYGAGSPPPMLWQAGSGAAIVLCVVRAANASFATANGTIVLQKTA